MKIHISENKEALYQKMAVDLLAVTSTINAPLVCPASGDTPIGLYHELVKRVHQNEASVASWKFIGLDEWIGMNGDDEGSCRNSLDNEFFNPVNVNKSSICFFDGKAAAPENECTKAEAFVAENGGISVAIVGLGMNGHIAMNEPGTPKNIRSHISNIAEETQQVGQKYFKSPKPITQGITLGIATLLESKHVMLMVTGVKKAGIVKKILASTEETANIPATYFLQHPNLTVYLDKEAASLLYQ